jgi:dihydrofolate synthase/folylpolyglutamate synthase
MNYGECLRYLEKIQNLGIKFGLDNVRAVLSALSNPHQKYPSVLIAGTNGKGSVCAMLSQILTLHGFRVGLFTSPHLVRVEERIRIGKAPIAARALCRILTWLKKTIEGLIDSKILLSPPTYFELLTCLALVYFQEQKVDMAVLEVGMGGRFDATNVVDPVLTVITTISAEHQKFLGESLEQIAFEKAGIMRESVPVVCGVEPREAFLTIKKRAEELRAPFFGVFESKESYSARKRRNAYQFEYRSDKEKYCYSPALPGRHQGKNAAVALVASERLSENWKNLEKEKIIRGVETVRWEGRMEVISSSPLVVLDGAHNEEGAMALRDYIRDFIPTPIILVYASMRDKKIEMIADILFPLSRMVILTRFPFFKGASPEEIKGRVSKFENRLFLEPDPKKALLTALENAARDDCILVTGSLYIVGEIKKFFPHGIRN